MRRFYTSVDIAPRGGGFGVTLDGKPVRTPAKGELTLPTRALAEAVAAEWAAQGETIKPHDMPLTQLASTAIDRTPLLRGEIVDRVAAYAETDLLCYRAERPAELARWQHALWQPLLDWAAVTHDAALVTTAGVLPAAQPAGAVAALRTAVSAVDDWRLTGLQQATALSGSVVVGLALLAGRLDAEAAFAAAQLDETYQMEQWGEDAEAAARREAIRGEMAAVERFLRLLDAPG